ncbi:MAG TPA: regulatory protein RecX [Bacteroidales bacterium]|mgnify:CR=1 FL=1|nr:regulatory protein RecX [Bacteroidales bacterium]
MVSEKHSPDEILPRIERYCAYQERCQWDVIKKLHFWKVPRSENEAILRHLEKEGFLDETRFARAFVRGKFTHNKWGRIKIRYELKGRRIPEPVIQTALREINEEEYLRTLKGLIERKRLEIKKEDDSLFREKILNFVTGKGFEAELAREWIA